MSMKTYLTALVVFFAIDMVWLGIIASRLYRHYLGSLMAERVNWPAAIVFYGVFIAGLVYFVIEPAESLRYAIGAGAFFGFLTYATYDLTNLATLKGWPLTITIIDLLWGSFLCASVSGITYWILHKFF